MHFAGLHPVDDESLDRVPFAQVICPRDTSCQAQAEHLAPDVAYQEAADRRKTIVSGIRLVPVKDEDALPAFCVGQAQAFADHQPILGHLPDVSVPHVVVAQQ